jgi:aminodeoxyfutalosine synthase
LKVSNQSFAGQFKVPSEVKRLSSLDALEWFQTSDLNTLGAAANQLSLQKNGQKATYIVNRYINYSNYCILSCQFCSFSRKKRDQDGFELSLEEMQKKAQEALALGITELHIVGGLHPSHLNVVGYIELSFE